ARGDAQSRETPHAHQRILQGLDAQRTPVGKRRRHSLDLLAMGADVAADIDARDLGFEDVDANDAESNELVVHGHARTRVAVFLIAIRERSNDRGYARAIDRLTEMLPIERKQLGRLVHRHAADHGRGQWRRSLLRGCGCYFKCKRDYAKAEDLGEQTKEAYCAASASLLHHSPSVPRRVALLRKPGPCVARLA